MVVSGIVDDCCCILTLEEQGTEYTSLRCPCVKSEGAEYVSSDF